MIQLKAQTELLWAVYDDGEQIEEQKTLLDLVLNPRYRDEVMSYVFSRQALHNEDYALAYAELRRAQVTEFKIAIQALEPKA